MSKQLTRLRSTKRATKKFTVAVLAGGDAAERQISHQSGRAVVTACRTLGYRALLFDPAHDLTKLCRAKNQIDVVFPALHGRGGENGSIQGLLELLQLPYVGSGLIASATAFGKVLAKAVYRQAKLPVARDFVALKSDSAAAAKALKKVGLPCFVKPANEGSSYGASAVRKRSELLAALKKAWRYDAEVLVEELIEGTEISVGVLEIGDQLQALPIAEIHPKFGFFDLKAKYNPKLCAEIIPAEISNKLKKKAQTFAKKAHQILQLRDLSRTDMLIRNDKIYLLETNTLPGLTPNSLFPKMARAAEISFEKLVGGLLNCARSRL